MIGQSEIIKKEAQGKLNGAAWVSCRHVSVVSSWPRVGKGCWWVVVGRKEGGWAGGWREGAGIRWHRAPLWRRVTWKNMQIWRRAMWVAIKLRIRLYHWSILLVSGSPSQCMEFHCGDNKMVKRKENYIYKKRNNICVIGHFSGCHFVFPFWRFMVCMRQFLIFPLPLPPPRVPRLSTQSHWSLLHKGWLGRGVGRGCVHVQISLNLESSLGGV